MSIDDIVIMQGGKKGSFSDAFPTEHGESRTQLFVLARPQLFIWSLNLSF